MVSVVRLPRVLRDLSRSRTTAFLSFPWLSAPRPQHHQHEPRHLPKRRLFHVGHHPHHQHDRRCHDHEGHAGHAQATSGGSGRGGAGEKIGRAAWQNALPDDTVAQHLPDLKRSSVAFVLDGSTSDVAAFAAAEFLASTGRIGVTVFAVEAAPHTVHVSGGPAAREAGAGHSLNKENRTAEASSSAVAGSTTLGAGTDQGAFAHFPFISRLQNKRTTGGTGRSGVSTRFAYLLKTWGERGVYDESSRQLDLRKLLADFRHDFTGSPAGNGNKDRSEISSTGKSSPATPEAEQDTIVDETTAPAVVHWGRKRNCEAGVEGDSDCDDFDWVVYGSAKDSNSVSDVVERFRENTKKRFLMWYEGRIRTSTAGADAASRGGTVHSHGGNYEKNDSQKKVQRACFLFPAADKCEAAPDGGATSVVMDLRQLERRVLVGQASAAKIWALIDKETRKDAQKQVAEEDARAEPLAAAGRAGQSIVDTGTSTSNITKTKMNQNKSASVLSAAAGM